MLVGFIQSLLYVLTQNKISDKLCTHLYACTWLCIYFLFIQGNVLTSWPTSVASGFELGFSFTRFTFCDKNSLLEQVLQTVHVDNVKINSSE